MKYIMNSFAEFYEGLKGELKLLKNDKASRKELLKYLTSKEYMKLVVLVLIMGTAHGVILHIIKHIASINI